MDTVQTLSLTSTYTNYPNVHVFDGRRWREPTEGGEHINTKTSGRGANLWPPHWQAAKSHRTLFTTKFHVLLCNVDVVLFLKLGGMKTDRSKCSGWNGSQRSKLLFQPRRLGVPHDWSKWCERIRDNKMFHVMDVWIVWGRLLPLLRTL